jgi:hypothetical protein
MRSIKRDRRTTYCNDAILAARAEFFTTRCPANDLTQLFNKIKSNFLLDLFPGTFLLIWHLMVKLSVFGV